LTAARHTLTWLLLSPVRREVAHDERTTGLEIDRR
jgi:hypothetical protein